MSGWDQRYDLEDDDDSGEIDSDSKLWIMVGLTALAVIVACVVWVLT